MNAVPKYNNFVNTNPDAAQKIDGRTSRVAPLVIERMSSNTEAVQKDNERRVQCRHCDLMILPENMRRHVWACHTPIEKMFNSNGDAVGLDP